ncbi:2-succinyl-5-enolpyruvyl-6-hydroxy-3-cyclohexene-1-carboxylic-acid synthase [hydrothermal vent metagenome]|uniref:2-succinyl-5-enolpyruvyl-6-hydroxy-3-cyclohexene-1-carboxylic-acid synthase n=2 Tax=hydrothermal vent metagenome TaxID=652676 RepID=A0A3B1BYD5_9ZZZZ
MKQSINRNILWTELFVSALERLGVKHACISPGSRNTPLTIAFQRSSKIKSYIHVDERSSGFFALGLANKTNKPVVIVTTSGTAVAELYPAIIEAYQQRVSLIVCTADRPLHLLNTGANQTINQIDIYNNHIHKYYSADLPGTNSKAFNHLLSITKNAFSESIKSNRPVHINFPFDKPFEPSRETDKIDKEFLKKVKNKFKSMSDPQPQNKIKASDIVFILRQIKNSKRRIILAGPLNIMNRKLNSLFQFAKKTNSLILADGLSGLRITKITSNNLIVNHPSFLRSVKVRKNLDPDLVIQIGSAPTSNSVLDFYADSKAIKIIINQFGELKDPSRTTDKIISAEYSKLLETLNNSIDKNFKHETDKEWLKIYSEIDKRSEEIKQKSFTKSLFPFEGKIISEVINLAPDSANIMVSNSLPVRDVDAFAGRSKKRINIFSNRGASGIDGIISTSSGIAVEDKNPTFLIIGDLAFYHDITGLLSLKKYSIPIVIILLNNSGGGIFELLPIAKEKIDFQNYFKTPLGVDFKNITKAFYGNYKIIKNWNEFSNELKKAAKRKSFSVLEIKIDSQKTLQIRKNIWNEIKQTAESLINGN